MTSRPTGATITVDALGRRHHKTKAAIGLCAIGSCKDTPHALGARYCKTHEERESKPINVDNYTNDKKDVTEW